MFLYLPKLLIRHLENFLLGPKCNKLLCSQAHTLLFCKHGCIFFFFFAPQAIVSVDHGDGGMCWEEVVLSQAENFGLGQATGEKGEEVKQVEAREALVGAAER